MNHLSFNLIHNASATIFSDSSILEIVEFERFTNVKNDGVFWDDPFMRKNVTLQIINYFKDKYSVNSFGMLLLNPIDLENINNRWDINNEVELLNLFSAEKLIVCNHQESHAAGAYYQSNMDNAIIISFDGAGNDGNFNIFKASKENGIVEIKKIYGRVLGHRFTYFANFCNSIKKEPSWPLQGALIYPGKLMGLAGYGRVREEWLDTFNEYYKNYPDNDETNFKVLKKQLLLPDKFEGEIEADIAATAQYMFQKVFYDETYEYWKDSENVILTGGCAMNILNNNAIKELKNVFVPPNPSDCGLSSHQALFMLKPKQHQKCTFLGPEVWDKNTLMEYVIKYRGNIVTEEFIVNSLLSGKILGIVQGRSEVGPRALGHRSLICLATFENMKDILNKKVKNREWYRPFAPVCREEDAPTYFEINGSEYDTMSFCPKVKEEYQNILSSVTHIDGTARLQTVKDDSYLYKILKRLKEVSNNVPVLLNTSFNIAGKPILNTYRDAIWMLENTEMDGLILEDYYIEK
jgi:carbamoyltransferase